MSPSILNRGHAVVEAIIFCWCKYYLRSRAAYPHALYGQRRHLVHHNGNQRSRYRHRHSRRAAVTNRTAWNVVINIVGRRADWVARRRYESFRLSLTQMTILQQVGKILHLRTQGSVDYCRQDHYMGLGGDGSSGTRNNGLTDLGSIAQSFPSWGDLSVCSQCSALGVSMKTSFW